MFLGLALLTLAQVSHAADDRQAQEAVERVAHLFSSKSSIATVNMQISNEDGQRNLSMKIWSLGEKVLVRITSPQDEAGTAILKVGSDIRYYLPKSKRTVKVPASMAMTSWMGSDFTIDDLTKETFLTRDYSISISFAGQRGGVAVYEYTLTPKPEAAVVWGKIILQIRQADSVPTWQGFYDEDGKLVRELTFSEYKTMNGRLIPGRLVMKPADKDGQRTMIEYEDIKFDAPISEGTFSLPNLK
jgi:outer membrane lipoprotein-sorting protein